MNQRVTNYCLEIKIIVEIVSSYIFLLGMTELAHFQLNE